MDYVVMRKDNPTHIVEESGTPNHVIAFILRYQDMGYRVETRRCHEARDSAGN